MNKTIITIAMLFATITASAQNESNNKPKTHYQVGKAKITVWENTTDDSVTWKNFQVEKVYKKNGVNKTSNNFNSAELMDLKNVIDKVINEEIDIQPQEKPVK